MNKNGKSTTTTDVPDDKRFKRPEIQARHREKILKQAAQENVSPTYIFNKWMEAGEAVYDKKYPEVIAATT